MNGIFQTVLNMSITGAYIAAAIIILRLALKKLPKRYSYALWIILGIRLLCPFSFSSEASLFNLIKPETTENRMEYIPSDIEYSPVPQVTVSIPPVNSAVNEALSESLSPEIGASANPIQIVLFVCSVVWLAGAAAMLLYTVVSYLRVNKKVSNARLLQDNIFVSGEIDSPFVYGIFRPRIYLPESIPADETEYILAHERVHIKRGDHIVKLIAMAALCLHWFNPLVWVSYLLMTRDMELSCDERAVASFDRDVRKDYAEALLNMSMRQNKISLGGILAFGESNIKTRIKNVLSAKKPKVIATAAAVLIAIIAAVCLLTNAKTDNREDAPVTDTSAEYQTSETAAAVTETSERQTAVESTEISAAEPEGIDIDLDEGIPQICADYVTDYWNYLFKSGEFEPARYISDPDMLDYAYSQKFEYIGSIGPHVLSAHIISKEAQGSTTPEGRLWVAFEYDVAVDVDDGTTDTEHHKGYKAYFELDQTEDGLEVYRAYVLGGWELNELGIENETYPLPEVDLKAAVNNSLRMTEYSEDMMLWSPSGSENDRKAMMISYSLPHIWDHDRIFGMVPGINKSMEISPPYLADEKLPREYFTVDDAYGDEITVLDEEHYDDPSLSYTDFYHTAQYSSEMQMDIEKYDYVLTRGDYSINFYFYVDDLFLNRWVCEKIVSTFNIEEIPDESNAE